MYHYSSISEQVQPFPVMAESHYHDSYWKIIGRHQHYNTLEFFLLKQGEGIFFCGEQSHHLHPEDYVLINCNEYHHFEVTSDSAEFTIFKFMLDRLRLYRPTETATDFHRKICYNQILFKSRPNDTDIYQDLLSIAEYYDINNPIKQVKSLSLAFDIFFRLLEYHVEHSFSEKNSQKFGDNWKKLNTPLNNRLCQNHLLSL